MSLICTIIQFLKVCGTGVPSQHGHYTKLRLILHNNINLKVPVYLKVSAMCLRLITNAPVVHLGQQRRGFRWQP